MKRFFPFLFLIATWTVGSAQTIVMNFSTGVLSNSSGTALGSGALIQVIASPDATFAAPTGTSFVGGNDLLLRSVSSNTFGGAGISTFTVEIDVSTSPFNVLSPTWSVAVRWFPLLTTASSAPGFSTSYGQFDVSSDSTWKVPASGTTVDREFLTTTAGGSYSDAIGRANLTTAAVPEPSTYAALLGAAALLTNFLRRSSFTPPSTRRTSR